VKSRVAFVSVVPSPYQRDLFAALARRDDVELSVHYLEAESPDSPWPSKPLQVYEHVLPGRWIAVGNARVHINWPLPDLRECDLVVMNTLMSFTAQALMRGPLRRRRWIFWGERLGPNRSGIAGAAHALLLAPLRHARAIAGIGSWAVEDYRKRFPQLEHVSIPYHCDISDFAPAPRAERDQEVVILFCGQMIARKGLDLLLAAFAHVAEENASVRLLLVGREAELPRMLETIPPALRARIEYAGFQPPGELPRFFCRANLFVLPSRHDGWGVVVNQAIGAGLPIVCSDQVGAGFDLVREGVNGFRFPSGDVEALSSALRTLIRDERLRVEMGAASLRIAPDISPEAGARKWADLFSRIRST
jgi:glycosyltransferase involved in cell wall biosynthesis